MQNNENETNLSITSVDKTYDKIFKHMSRLAEGDIIKRKDCKFCQHPIRFEAEAEFELRSRSYAPVLKFFQTWEKQNPNCGLVLMKKENVRGHLLQHYAQQEKNKWLKEYGERITEMMNYKIDKEKRFEMMSNALELKFHELSSNPTLDLHKQVDSITKIVKSILEINVIQGRLSGDMKIVNVFIEKFQSCFLHQIKSAESPEVRNALVGMLDNLQNMDITVVPEIE